MRANLKNVDCVIEIHDARISFCFHVCGFKVMFQVRMGSSCNMGFRKYAGGFFVCWFVCFFFNKKYIPLSGRNPVFQETLDVRPHLLVLNKVDLADVSDEKVRNVAHICTTHSSWNPRPLFLNPNRTSVRTETSEDACEKGIEECFFHRLFKAKR